MLIFVVNAGSSSLKFALFDDAPRLPLVVKGGVSGLPDAARLRMTDANGASMADLRLDEAGVDATVALRRVLTELRARALLDRVGAVGHRIVHGGRTFTTPTRLDAPTIEALARLAPLAPLHQPFNLALVAVTQEALPTAAHVACFDTAFHATQPRLARVYGLPRGLTDDGVLAYGFHGLSFASIAARLRARHGPNAGGRVIVAHLGNGVSLCALAEGRSVATTMGFSVLDGPPMSTRCGTIDPGVVLHLIQERRMTLDAVRDLLYERSGLLGVSEISGDMAVLLDSDDRRAQEAVDLFVYRVAREIGSLAAALEGLDRLVFTGGIGEHADVIRARICERAAWLGVRVDATRNTRADEVISEDGSAVEVLVVPTDEERVIAEGVRACVSADAEAAANASVDAVQSEAVVERLQGHGFIRRGDETVAEIDYDVTFTPGRLRGRGITFEAGAPGHEPGRGPDIAGRLMGPLFQAQPFAGEVHTLVLEDGREFDFRVLTPDTNEITGVSALRASAARARANRP